MMKWFVVFLIFQSSLFAEKELVHRLQSYFIINDPSLALEQCEQALEEFPDSIELKKIYVRALAETGNESKAIKIWKDLEPLIENEKEKDACLEILAWGVLSRGKNSPQLVMKNFSLIGAFFTHDAKAVTMILSAMRSSNSMMRALAVRLASEYGDSILKEEIIELLKEEKIHFVRAEVIKAVGSLRIKEAGEFLKQLLHDRKTAAEEKFLAIQSLALLYDHIEKEEIESLLDDKRAGFRMLAAEIILRLELKEYATLLLSYLDDPNPDVKMCILSAIALLNLQEFSSVEKEKIARLCRDSHPSVAITAGWFALLLNMDVGQVTLEEKMGAKDAKIRRLAAAAVAFAGKKGLPLVLKQLEKSPDLYVQANLAASLIQLRIHEDRACDILLSFLKKTEKKPIMLQRELHPLFSMLAPSEVGYVPHIPNLPALVDGMTRLSLLNTLAMIEPEKATFFTKQFLRNSLWGLTATAAVILLEEGEMQSLEVVKQLLKDPDEKVRLQAALALAFIGGDETAVSTLEESYVRMDREIKLHILEAIGRIGSKKSIPFLVNVLEEPFQSLRIAAASALIQSLYH